MSSRLFLYFRSWDADIGIPACRCASIVLRTYYQSVLTITMRDDTIIFIFN